MRTNFSHSLSREPAVADFPHLDFGLFGQDTGGELLRRHFQREEQHRRAARDFRARFHVLDIGARGMEGHVGAQRGFAHAGPARQDQKVGGLQAAQQLVDIGEAGGDAGNAPAALLAPASARFHRPAQRFVEIERAFAIFARFR